MWTFDPGEAVDAAFFRSRIERALATREPVPASDEPAGQRLVYAESDALPGLVVDRYADHLVCQFLSAGAERWKGELVAALAGSAASLTAVESSGLLLEGLRDNLAASGLEGAPERVETVEGNAFSELRRFRAEERSFDLVVLDPPKFAETRSRVEAAARGYKDGGRSTA